MFGVYFGKYLEDVGVLTHEQYMEIVEASRTARAVSYTHLRAHETDSYLVCRLLLEKKKKKNREYSKLVVR